ncbi:MAG: peptidase domain-containing ABC transporter [Planctomycetes bacterium]|nr:peptidase domain-containing ABC transporter [Planctomycetota bacterium]
MGYACVRQHDQSDCGAAALATVALHHRLPIGLQKMRSLAGTDRVGTNLLGLLKAAERLGFSARGVRGPYDELPKVPLPAIAHIVTPEGFGHFVVLHKVEPRRVTAADPAKGVVAIERAAFEKMWSGALLLLTPGQALANHEATRASSPRRAFLALLRPQAGLLGEAFFAAILMTVLGLASSLFVEHLVDDVLVHGKWRLLNALGAGMLAVAVARTGLGAIRQYLLVHASRRIDLGMISGYTRHVLHQPVEFFALRRTGEILSRVNDAVKVRQAVSGATLTLFVDATLVIVSFAVMLWYDARLAAVAAAFVPAFLIAVGAHHPATRRLSRTAMEDAASLQSHLVEDVGGIETLKAFGAERRRAEDGEDRLVTLQRSLFSLQLTGVSTGSFGMLLAAAAGVLVLWYGGHRVMDGTLTVGQLMFFNTLLGTVLQPLERLAGVNLQIQDALVATDRLREILDLEAENPHVEGKAEFAGVKSAIRFENVSFRYGCRSEVLRGVDLDIPAGKTVAIVGESGSGKSTLIKLLNRFHDPTSGRVTADGMDVRDLSLASLRSRIGLVAQDPFVFSGTIRENIALGRPEAPLEEIAAAAAAAGLAEFVNALPQRWDTVVGEHGANLSGGQRQRLAIARALLILPDVLVFDEATSHLDTRTERAVQEALRGAFKGRTVVLVAHRLSTVRDADLIYVLHEGRVVEKGTHDQLVRAGRRYAELWRGQAPAELSPLHALESLDAILETPDDMIVIVDDPSFDMEDTCARR